ncbi:hypothetical protein MPHO_08070 [Mycolicibacterium phocaicum]|nr:hypothetical protein MPHO_08070 [Mycolicibacterium phocaicum]
MRPSEVISAKGFALARPNCVVTSWKSQVCRLASRNIRCAGDADADVATIVMAALNAADMATARANSPRTVAEVFTVNLLARA